ncbi:hypothetical protein [Nitratireductor sp. ZSWI3]|uniref:hypothetical protein n=1 Tax=Nitratireductor sp. ZSWI3 TaxID=2966359 RepID=UPI00214F91BC|nr:hypothetical protein [Nitratireductor sp. ZSWI3]MCR4268990.1 hypothetical protein [Nitratireductor sp. ZSWI3]
MGDDTEPRPERFRPANDNTGPQGEPDAETWRRIDQVALTLARIIGRRMAREDFERLTAANDNRPSETGNTEDGADTD